jgi:REP element-mobilizing transposase RayT
MPRRRRSDAPGTAHHVWLRGVERRALFLDDRDEGTYLDRLGRVLPDEGVRCLAWALMENHVHLVVLSGDRPISHAMHRIGTAYARHFNERYGHEGYVFQGRFGSRRVEDDADLRNLVRYVHRNPLAAGRVATLDELEHDRWCGYGAASGRLVAEPFHDVVALLLLFGEPASVARSALRDAMQNEPDGVVRSADPSDAPLARLIASVCAERGVEEGALRAGVRARDVVASRAVIARLARRELGISDVEIAAATGVSRQALWRRLGPRSGES